MHLIYAVTQGMDEGSKQLIISTLSIFMDKTEEEIDYLFGLLSEYEFPQ
jgi:hypothetical protein